MFKSLASTNFATWADDIVLLNPLNLLSLNIVALQATVYHNATWADDYLITPYFIVVSKRK